MLTINRIRRKVVNLRVKVQSRLAIRRADRVKRRALRSPNPGYDELRNPLFLGVTALAVLVLLVDITDAWQPLAAFIVALGEWARVGA